MIVDDYIGRDVEGSCRGLFLGTIPVLCGGTEESNENVCRSLSQDGQYANRYSKPASPEYEGGFMTTESNYRCYNNWA
jgi:hypothetical protein